MKDPIVYEFEELSDELPRAPMTALRALFQSGIVLSPKGWASLSPELRTAIALEGTKGIVDTKSVRHLMEQVPPRFLKLVSKPGEPNPDEVPQALSRALGLGRALSVGQWRALRAVDRYVLATLVSNTRLLWKAYDELKLGGSSTIEAHLESQARWVGLVAHVEVQTNPATISYATSSRFLDGRAAVLARAAGLRAARKAPETFDLLADAQPGPIELEWTASTSEGTITWQAHVSNYDGTFLSGASLIAAMTAATALLDMIREQDPKARIAEGSIREEAWLAAARDTFDDATALYTPAVGVSSSKSPIVDLLKDVPSSGRPDQANLAMASLQLDASRSQAPHSSPGPVSKPPVVPTRAEAWDAPPKLVPQRKTAGAATMLFVVAAILFVATLGLVAYAFLVARS